MSELLPAFIPNWVDGEPRPAHGGEEFSKMDPARGAALCRAARSARPDVDAAVGAARRAQPGWADRTPVERGDILRAGALLLRERSKEIAEIVHRETGKSLKDAAGETQAAIEMGFFVAGEGRRYYGHTVTSAIRHKTAMTIRQPVGIAALIVPANTPIANVAWKTFPALLCGNAAVLKSSEDAPATAWAFTRILHEAGVPSGALGLLHGLGEEAGEALVDHPDVALVSFTGSYEVGRRIQQRAGARLAKVCVEAGGKNPLVVCDDADLEDAARAAVLSAFSNAGQRCAAGSRVIVFDAVYDRFLEIVLDATRKLRVGTSDTDDLGPVINEDQLRAMLAVVQAAAGRGARILTGGSRLEDPAHAKGYFMAPTWLDRVPPGDEISTTEVFGPVSCLYRVKGFEEALGLANDSPYGLTASIHTPNLHRAMTFLERIRAGVAVVNGATYGSEPHMPFSGLKRSGNGTREAGREALDVYSEWKTVYINHKPSSV